MKLKHDELLSNVAFNCNQRHYIKALPNNTGTLSVVMNETGGIIDDTVVTKVNDEDIYIVLNGGCADKDKARETSQQFVHPLLISAQLAQR